MSSRRALCVSVSVFAFGLLSACGVTVPGGFDIDIDPITAAGSGGSRVPVSGIGGGVAGRGGGVAGAAGSWNGTSGTGAAGVWGGYAGTWSGGAAGAAGVAGTWSGGYAGTWSGGYAGTWSGGYAGTWSGGYAGTWGGYAGTWGGAAGTWGAAGVGGWGEFDNDGDGYPQIKDCDDYNWNVHAGAMDICCDFVDSDCDGRDASASVMECRCPGQPTEPPYIDRDGDGWTERDGDCNDYDGSMFPGAPEYCYDGRDQNCDGLSDFEDWRCRVAIDNDGDTWDQSVDCDDYNSSINPGMPEYCGDGVDNNCDGLIDPYRQCQGQGFDWDQDGYPTEKDCNDSDSSVYPGSPYERCCDGVDSNCDNDDGFVGKICTCATPGDSDGDGYGVGLSDPRYADCNDQDANIHPNAVEECSDTKDNDCDGWVDAKDPDCGITID